MTEGFVLKEEVVTVFNELQLLLLIVSVIRFESLLIKDEL